MKAIKNKQTGKVTIKLTRKEPIISHWSDPQNDAKAKQQFAKHLRESGDRVDTLERVSDRQYKDSRPSINKDKL